MRDYTRNIDCQENVFAGKILFGFLMGVVFLFTIIEGVVERATVALSQ